MITVHSKEEALHALQSGENEVRCMKVKANKRNGAYLPNGRRAPNRGQAELVAHTEKAINQFYN